MAIYNPKLAGAGRKYDILDLRQQGGIAQAQPWESHSQWLQAVEGYV